jgi:fructokinase
MDIFQDYQRIGGAPFNFAFHLKKMGFQVRFFTRVGDDGHGRQIVDMLKENGFSATDVQIDSRHPTGTVGVDLDERGVPHFDIRENVAYDYLKLDSLKDLDRDAVRMITFGTLAQRTDHGYSQIRHFITKKAAHSTCFCDINMRPPHVNFQAVENCLGESDILKLNDAELAVLQERIHGPRSQDAYVDSLMARFGIETVALTLGARGSALYQQGQVVYRGPSADTVVADTVGAGDGYGAVLALGCLNGLAPARIIELAAGFASRICSIRGAVPEDEKIYNDLLNQIKGENNGR